MENLGATEAGVWCRGESKRLSDGEKNDDFRANRLDGRRRPALPIVAKGFGIGLEDACSCRAIFYAFIFSLLSVSVPPQDEMI